MDRQRYARTKIFRILSYLIGTQANLAFHLSKVIKSKNQIFFFAIFFYLSSNPRFDPLTIFKGRGAPPT